MQDVRFQDFQSVGDDQMGFAFPFGSIGSAAPTMRVAPGLEVLVECKVVQAKIDSSIRTKVEFNCEQNNFVSTKEDLDLFKKTTFARNMLVFYAWLSYNRSLPGMQINTNTYTY